MERFVILVVAVTVAACSAAPDRTVILGSFRLIQAADTVAPTTRITEDDAARTALAKLTEIRPDVMGLAIVDVVAVVGLKEVDHGHGNEVFRTDEPRNVWAFRIRGPAQGGFARAEGLVIVDMSTGEVVSAQLLLTSDLP